jgi:hypothetical protein
MWIHGIMKRLISFLREFYLTAPRERGSNSRKIELSENQVSHGQLMEGLFHKHIFELTNMEHPKV